jgi:hypothetical protein
MQDARKIRGAQFEAPRVRERVTDLPFANTSRRGRALKLVSYGLCAGIGVWSVLYNPIAVEKSGRPHCYQYVRSWFKEKKAAFLGIDMAAVRADAERKSHAATDGAAVTQDARERR